MAWRPLILGSLASLIAAFAAAAADQPVSVTGEVVTIDALGIHLVDRAGKFFVIDNPQRLRLKRGTMITVEGGLLTPGPAGPSSDSRAAGSQFSRRSPRRLCAPSRAHRSAPTAMHRCC